MRIINTAETVPNDLDAWEREQIYNALDCCVTAEVLDVLLPQLDQHTSRTYDLSRSLQGPALEMRLRGVLVDQTRKNEVIDEFYEKIDVLERNLDRIVLEGVGMPGFNWRSNADLQTLFYEKLKIQPILRGGRPTVNRDALEKMENYLIARPIVRHITTMRDLAKKISVLKTEIDPDGRIRTSYNIAGTNTGRFSSSLSEFGTGGNLQNVEESLRSILIADPGYKFAKFDAKSGESYIVGAIEWNLFRDSRYLDAVESGDVHTAVAKLCWPGLPWSGDLKKDKLVAERPFYRHYTYRFMCKKIGHGSNYGGKPQTISSQTKLPINVIADFQPKYFRAFGHLGWHEWVDNELRRKGVLVSLTGRKRQFWGRRNDEATLREAIAYDPQCSLADIVNRAMLRLWSDRVAILMLQDHDALTFMYPEKDEEKVIPTLMAALPEIIDLKHGRQMSIPYDCKIGWNRGDWSSKNPDGLLDWKGHDDRSRSPPVHWLDKKRA